jgi:hypothetical protein
MMQQKPPPQAHAEALGAAIYIRTPVTPEQAFRAIGALRREARAEIERLIRFLDDTDGHMELEPDDEGDDSDTEPALGSFDRMTDQSKAWRQSAGELCFSIDAEQDDADNEDDGISEPSLGSIGDVHFDQGRWAFGNPCDLELDDAESSGIGDQDGLLEQVGTQDWQQGAMA